MGKSATAVAELFSVTERISSLDAPLSDSDDRALIEQLVVEGEMATPKTEDVAGSRIAGWIAQLPERQRLVLQRRFGLDDHGVQTLAEIAGELGLTRERVRQIQTEALKRLRGIVEREDAA